MVAFCGAGKKQVNPCLIFVLRLRKTEKKTIKKTEFRVEGTNQANLRLISCCGYRGRPETRRQNVKLGREGKKQANWGLIEACCGYWGRSETALTMIYWISRRRRETGPLIPNIMSWLSRKARKSKNKRDLSWERQETGQLKLTETSYWVHGGRRDIAGQNVEFREEGKKQANKCLFHSAVHEEGQKQQDLKVLNFGVEGKKQANSFVMYVMSRLSRKANIAK